MSDIFMAAGDATASGNIIFGKNSHREPNEAQTLVRVPRANHAKGDVALTHISIPQIAETNEVILSKPFHMWGAEMGANEHGLVVGSAAVFTKVKIAKKNDGLTGMDMVRLALERTRDAERALELITNLLEQYGQDAGAGYQNKSFHHHNSFMIADGSRAFVLETAGEHWVAARIKGFRSISNGLTIESEYDFAGKNVVDFARQNGWIKQGAEFSFRGAYSDWFMTTMSMSRTRRELSSRLGDKSEGRLDAAGAMAILRNHGTRETRHGFRPSASNMGCLCVHAAGITTPVQTTGSMVAELRTDKNSTYWFTGTAAPCLSLFKPFFAPGTGIRAGDITEPGRLADNSLWWRAERLHRFTLLNYPARLEMFREERDALETEFLKEEAALSRGGANLDQLNGFSARAWKKADAALDNLLERMGEYYNRGIMFSPIYNAYRKRLDKFTGLVVR